MVDGVALDGADSLYVASIGDNAVYRWRDGDIETIIRDPNGLTIGNSTNIAFGGDMRMLYVANLALWHITALKIDTSSAIPQAIDEYRLDNTIAELMADHLHGFGAE